MQNKSPGVFIAHHPLDIHADRFTFSTKFGVG